MSALLQLFLLIDVFIIGVVAAIAVRHGRAHLWHKEQQQKGHGADQNGHLPAALREHMLEEAQASFQKVLERSNTEMQKDLQASIDKLTKLLDQMGSEVVSGELDHYRSELDKFRKQAEDDIGGARAALADQQTAIKAELDKDMVAEKQRVLEQLDTNLGNAVGSFLLETLQHNVDLGAQMPYLLSTLEEHKAELMKEVGGGEAAIA